MRMTLASFKWNDYLKEYRLLAQGGVSITFLIWLCAQVQDVPFLVNGAKPVLAALSNGASNPHAFLMFVVLILFLVCLALSGHPVIDFLARQLIRPALDFVQAATFVGTGIVLACAMLFLQGRYLQSAVVLFFISIVLHTAVKVMDFYSKPSRGEDAISQSSRVSVSLMAFAALGVLFVAID